MALLLLHNISHVGYFSVGLCVTRELLRAAPLVLLDFAPGIILLNFQCVLLIIRFFLVAISIYHLLDRIFTIGTTLFHCVSEFLFSLDIVEFLRGDLIDTRLFSFLLFRFFLVDDEEFAC